MDRTHKTERISSKEEVELMLMNAVNVSDDSALFTIDDIEFSDAPLSPLPSPLPRMYERQTSQSSYINAGFQDYQRQESNIHSPFDGDTVFLFNSPRKRRFNIKKKLAKAWCATCVFKIWQYIRCSCSFECNCRDQRGVHCIYRLKQKMLRKLKVLQGILCLITIIQSGMVFLPLGNITADFDGQCLLYSNLFIYKNKRNDTVSLDLTRSQFGSKEDCNFTTFINVVVSVAGLFFIWFFIHTSYVNGLEQTEAKLQLPVFLCYLILFVSVVVSSFKITIGFNSWCYNIVFNNQFQFERQRLKCKDYETLQWSTENNRSHFYTYFVLAEVSTWLLTLTLVLQLSVTTVHLYQNIKTAYDEIEVPHLKLQESSDCSDGEQTNWESRDVYTSLDCSVQPLPAYTVEYRNHKVLAKVVIHSDKVASKYQKFDPKSTFILDKEKFKRNIIGIDQFSGLRPRGKVDFPLKMEPGRRKRLNWTGSCEELHLGIEYEDQTKKHKTALCHEWHGFDTNENFYMDQNFDWHIEFGSKSHRFESSQNLQWPTTNYNSNTTETGIHAISQSLPKHGFESDFVNYPERNSGSLPGDWQTFDMNFENQVTGQFVLADQEEQTESHNPWTFMTPDDRTREENNVLNTETMEDIENVMENDENSNEMDIFHSCEDHFTSDER